MNEAIEHQGRMKDKVDTWNASYPPGTPVLFKKDNGEYGNRETESEARLVLNGHAARIMVSGHGDCNLTRVIPLDNISNIVEALKS